MDEKQSPTQHAPAMREGDSVDGQGNGQNPPNSDSVSLLSATPVGPGFDLLATLGEAEQFAWAIKGFIDQSPLALDPRWRAISGAMDVAIAAHDKLNSTPAR